jgi:hypothetical protein
MERELLERDLDEFVEGDNWPEPMANGSPTPVADGQAVAAVVNRLKRLHAERREILDVAQAQIDRINEWCADRVAGIDRDIAWGERSIEHFMRGYAETSHKKSLSLPAGTPRLTAAREKVEITDNEAFLSWALGVPGVTAARPADLVPAHPELLRARYEADKTALSNLKRGPKTVEDGTEYTPLLLDGGELIPGVTVMRSATDTFTVKINED